MAREARSVRAGTRPTAITRNTVQIHAVVEFLKTLASEHRYPSGDLNFERPIRTNKPFPEDEALLIHRVGDGPGEGSRNTLYYARRFGTRFQGEVKASRPGVTGEPAEKEIEVGIKRAFFADRERSLLLGAGLEAEIPL